MRSNYDPVDHNREGTEVNLPRQEQNENKEQARRTKETVFADD